MVTSSKMVTTCEERSILFFFEVLVIIEQGKSKNGRVRGPNGSSSKKNSKTGNEKIGFSKNVNF